MLGCQFWTDKLDFWIFGQQGQHGDVSCGVTFFLMSWIVSLCEPPELSPGLEDVSRATIYQQPKSKQQQTAKKKKKIETTKCTTCLVSHVVISQQPSNTHRPFQRHWGAFYFHDLHFYVCTWHRVEVIIMQHSLSTAHSRLTSHT